MAIDTSPSTVATSALQAIPFQSLIGGPLDACIAAQAKAAQTTWQFIQEVGLNADSNGQRSAINVSFQYQKGSQMVNLVVPLLTIVPIPFIAINDITIDFIANISAQASTSSVTTESTEMGGEASVGGSFWGIHFDMKANYSSKKDSTAAAESKYSVEYTMNVHVQAGQESMPAGLQSILNILNSSLTEASPTGSFTVVSGPLRMPAGTTEDQTGTITVRLLDNHGLAVPGVAITFAPAATPPFPAKLTLTSTSPLTTDDKGEISVGVKLATGSVAADAGTYNVDFNATINLKSQTGDGPGNSSAVKGSAPITLLAVV